MAKRIADRYTTAGDLAEDLRRAIRAGSPAARSGRRSGPVEATPAEPRRRRSAPARPCPSCGRTIPAGVDGVRALRGLGLAVVEAAGGRRPLDRAEAPRDRAPAGHGPQLRVRAGGRRDLALGARPRGPARAPGRVPPVLPRGGRPARRDGRGGDAAGAPGLLRLPGRPRGRRPPGRSTPALAIVERVEALNERLRRTRGVGAGPLGGDPQRPGRSWATWRPARGCRSIGEAPSVATRLENVVEPGWVAITEATRRLVPGFFACEPLGARAIRGLAQAGRAPPGRPAGARPPAGSTWPGPPGSPP